MTASVTSMTFGSAVVTPETTGFGYNKAPTKSSGRARSRWVIPARSSGAPA
ncbi:MAG: hypothetical protein R2856_18845 [Caldilineaceae bacterium]